MSLMPVQQHYTVLHAFPNIYFHWEDRPSSFSWFDFLPALLWKNENKAGMAAAALAAFAARENMDRYFTPLRHPLPHITRAARDLL